MSSHSAHQQPGGSSGHTVRSSPETETPAEQNLSHRLRLFVHPAPCWSNIHSNTMATVVDTKLYDILGVSPSATENELKKVIKQESTNERRNYI